MLKVSYNCTYFTCSKSFKIDFNNKEREEKDFPDGPVVESVLSLQREWVQSLVGELRSRMPHALPKHKTKKGI